MSKKKKVQVAPPTTTSQPAAGQQTAQPPVAPADPAVQTAVAVTPAQVAPAPQPAAGQQTAQPAPQPVTAPLWAGVQAVVSKYAVVTAIILLAAVALFFIGKSNAPVTPAVLVTAPAQDGGVKVVPASHTVTTAWDDDLRSAVESNSSRITRLENKLYVRADGVVTTAPKAFWLFNRTKLGEKLDASK